MIISPPFLPSGQAQNSDEDWVTANMPDAPSQNTPGPAGSYPLGYNLAWHNGMHIDAQALARVNNGQVPPARAVADGKVVFAQAPSAMSPDPKHPQNYNPWDDSETPTPRWTDNGIVVIEHTTAIGAHGNSPTELGNTPTVLVYYSVYMHLAALGKMTPAGKGSTTHPWQAGDIIWRKDEVGTPGQIYGASGQIHFEICMNAENVKVLLGREPAWVEPGAIPAPTQDGRTDSIYGSIYFYVDNQTPASTTQPTVHTRQRSNTVVGANLWVRMTYHKGGCRYDTFDTQGRLLGWRDDTDGALEYNLYALAKSRHNSLSGADLAASSPSGWYELLRFGRNIGYGANTTDRDPTPKNAAHWRCIKSPAGQDLWIDLNAEGVRKFSDADFPPAMGWNCADDDTNPNDQRCDSKRLKEFIADPNPSNAQRMDIRSLAARLADPQVRTRVSTMLASFPCEWQRSTVEARYGFVKETESFKKAPTAWSRLQAHIQAMTFNALPPALVQATWHIHPRTFVAHTRKCLWLSFGEINQVLGAAPAAGKARAQALGFPMNLVLRKYGLQNRRARSAHFLAQVGHETGWWQYREEIGNERYFRTMYEVITAPEAAIDYQSGLAARLNLLKKGETEQAYAARRPGAVAVKAQSMDNGAANASTGGMIGDGARFRGRGFLQITGRRNYTSYGKFRGKDFVTDPNPKMLASDDVNACNASGFYWARENANSEADAGTLPRNVTRVGGIVNRGSASKVPLHDTERHTAFDGIWKKLNDTI